ncbi:hypothetical protein CDAR_10071 [Caerostris darwini]|uniref:Uncharacterized protein n=1 Tax=Caerostris darwini TaxID=1538125 RepID=A0AAV4MDH0_9ARAC|nr:hypothetical protein CDAR_10071 [Caerostris darwini]
MEDLSSHLNHCSRQTKSPFLNSRPGFISHRGHLSEIERNFGTHKRDGIRNLVTDSFLTAAGPGGHREEINSAQSNKVLVYFVLLTIPLNGGPSIIQEVGCECN